MKLGVEEDVSQTESSISYLCIVSDRPGGCGMAAFSPGVWLLSRRLMCIRQMMHGPTGQLGHRYGARNSHARAPIRAYTVDRYLGVAIHCTVVWHT